MNILTFDIEEWFHILDNDSTKTEKEWEKYPIRIYENMERIFHILDKKNVSATFFIMGWIAKKHPQIIKEIINRGYEIASHTQQHQLVYEQTPLEFKKDVEYSIKLLEDLSGKKIKYFRAPGFSITTNNLWAFDVLTELGIEIDCSIFPANRGHGGFPSFGKGEPALIKHNGMFLKELPINSINLLSKPIIFSGGGYFRLFPYFLVKKWTKKSNYMMSYLHPRDFDKNQPMIKELSLIRKFKSYFGLKGATKKLEKWLNDFNFIDIQEADKQINWEKVKIIAL